MIPRRRRFQLLHFPRSRSRSLSARFPRTRFTSSYLYLSRTFTLFHLSYISISSSTRRSHHTSRSPIFSLRLSSLTLQLCVLSHPRSLNRYPLYHPHLYCYIFSSPLTLLSLFASRRLVSNSSSRIFLSDSTLLRNIFYVLTSYLSLLLFACLSALPSLSSPFTLATPSHIVALLVRSLFAHSFLCFSFFLILVTL
ncbi:hypothetical protein BDY24DRAFT_384220 [Mrakia frigida]|uniref:uncharacterized protein n=1 Tax=Mrakia frigida TaxID=29902 RepID=UPI003FCC0052